MYDADTSINDNIIGIYPDTTNENQVTSEGSTTGSIGSESDRSTDTNGLNETVTDSEGITGATTEDGEGNTTEQLINVIDEEQFNILIDKSDNILNLLADILAYINIFTTVIVPLIAIVCLFWWFANGFFR